MLSRLRLKSPMCIQPTEPRPAARRLFMIPKDLAHSMQYQTLLVFAVSGFLVLVRPGGLP